MKPAAYAFTLALVVALTGCGTAPRYQAPMAPVTAQVEPPDETSGFSTPEEDEKADAAIASAQTGYKSVQATIAGFTAGSKCNDRGMATTLATLQSIDESAQRYVGMATTASEPADREAAMDVLDELNTVVLDGLLDVAKAYRSQKCFAYARHIITEAKSIYAGPAYANWMGAMDSELAAINAEAPVAPVAKPAIQKRTKARKAKTTKALAS